MNAKYQPLKYHENVCIFYKKRGIYNPQMIKRESTRIQSAFKENHKTSTMNYGTELFATKNSIPLIYGNTPEIETTIYHSRNPDCRVHFQRETPTFPSKKQLLFFEYFIKTYTEPNMVVLDAFAGTSTVIEACLKTKRNYIAIEPDKNTYNWGSIGCGIILIGELPFKVKTTLWRVMFVLKPLESVVNGN